MTGEALAFTAVRFAHGAAPVLADIDFAVAKGAVTALMGPSGCGKSTLLAIAAGLLQPAAGEVRRDHRRAAIMFQDPLLLPWRRALANVAFALKADRLPAAERRRRAMAALAAVGLSGADLGKYPRQLSGGMRQRVALARALVVGPDLLLLDEPFGALDSSLARQMQALVRRHVETMGAAVLLVTHDAREAARIAERVVILSPAPARVVRVCDLPGRPGTRSEAELAAIAATLLAAQEAGEGAGTGQGPGQTVLAGNRT